MRRKPLRDWRTGNSPVQEHGELILEDELKTRRIAGRIVKFQ